MLELISIHIPKTAGTSFYAILQDIYGANLSISYKRKDIKAINEEGLLFHQSLSPTLLAIHGHFTYQEIAKIHHKDNPKLICWLRDPLERLHSNFRFFKRTSSNKEKHPEKYQKNRMRLNESFESYASRPGTQNKVSQFIGGVPLSAFDFIGFQETFSEDFDRLRHILNWPEVSIPTLNTTREQGSIDSTLQQQLIEWNRLDIKIYCEALLLSGRSIPSQYSAFID